jgi:hypothetical protein
MLKLSTNDANRIAGKTQNHIVQYQVQVTNFISILIHRYEVEIVRKL